MVKTMDTRSQRAFAFWLSPKEKIVSFHPVRGYKRIEFSTKEHFLGEILSMSYAGYRFQ